MQALKQSFAMMIILGPGYVNSPWCLKELLYFKKECLKGQPEELLRRLFIIVTDKDAEHTLLQSRDWPKDVFIDSIRSQFYEKGSPIPLLLRMDASFGPGEATVVENPDFTRKVGKLIARLADEINKATEGSIEPPGADSRLRRIMIGPFTAGLSTDVDQLASSLNARMIETDLVAVNDIISEGAADSLRERAKNCALLIQPYAEAPPILGYQEGGHLAVVRNYLSELLPIWWWRPAVSSLTVTSGVTPVYAPIHTRFFEELRAAARCGSAEQLGKDLDTWFGRSDGCNGALLFFESSNEQYRDWEKIRSDVESWWSREAPAIPLMCMALPFKGRKTPELRALRDGHGVVLLLANIDYGGLLRRARLVDEVLFETRSKLERFVAWLPKEAPNIPHEDYVWKTIAFHGRDDCNRQTMEPDRLREVLRAVAQKAGSPAIAN
jgi:hypothetical protein